MIDLRIVKYIKNTILDECTVRSLFFMPIHDQMNAGESNGIWKKEMMEGLLVADSTTAILRPEMTSDPWIEMMDSEGNNPEADENIRGEWTEECEETFQSVASSEKDQFVIFEQETGAKRTLAKDEIIAKFREDRIRNKVGFTIVNEDEDIKNNEN